MAEAASGNAGVVEQRIFVMRHGERQDTRDPSWKKTAERPYDTPITSRGKLEAFRLSERRFKGKVRSAYIFPESTIVTSFYIAGCENNLLLAFLALPTNSSASVISSRNRRPVCVE